MPDKQPETKLFTGSSMDFQTFLAERERRIATHGWMVMTVAPHELCVNYSIGLHDRGLPELIALGLDPVLGHELVNDVCQLLSEAKSARPQDAMEVRPLGWHRPFTLISVEARVGREVALGAAQRSQFQAEYMQIVYADRNGRYPWDPLCTPACRGRQPLLASVN